ncbi:unnamed protein product [Pleuronectes platessa]|uniref:Uncharacterized protein n=1 Tax=Pleuronectes platessa TaxID=8262 RepID=A0A9N7U419_PLEPL|nr:unnamed protein product [Pleuronectes platessa]
MEAVSAASEGTWWQQASWHADRVLTQPLGPRGSALHLSPLADRRIYVYKLNRTEQTQYLQHGNVPAANGRRGEAATFECSCRLHDLTEEIRERRCPDVETECARCLCLKPRQALIRRWAQSL